MQYGINQNILVAYFSHSGNTREIARQIQQNTGGEIFEIASVQPYPRNYNAVVEQARQELKAGYKPELKTKMESIESFKMVFIGYPNWWGTIPAPVKTFLSLYDFSGKTIIPFCTHEGSGLGRSTGDILKLCPKSSVLDGIAIRGGSVKTAQNQVTGWLQTISIGK